ncbi:MULTISPECIES: LPS export ABC transporter permease LptG [Halomonadaceae]|uniref:LPS export ABC transporter permease LptG n=1 Tax=Vreelandella halophila TaxID=86177 RepID=A0A9X4Y9F2_9GAMM|nr:MULTISPECIES: LPS export ABC transporter permease LptG [Halomonas]MYL25697.1 LPS export ABC transporter permease LptG [Halomonas utahensis]MYL76028.1 LPS export ABC transporter permease LptG [Halomonas sp. 22501_18_FS]
MRLIDGYIMRVVAAAILLVLLVVQSLDFVFAYIAELEDTVNDYQAWEAFLFMLYTLPRRIYEFLPLAAFMGALVGLGQLANNSELVVIRAAGVSLGRVTWSAMKPALVVVVISLLIGDFVAPPLEQAAQSNKAVARHGGQAAATHGFWHREDDVFMHFNTVLPNGELHGVSLFRFGEDEWLEEALYAKRGEYQGDYWLLHDVSHSRIREQSVSTEEQDTFRWENGLSPDVLSVLTVRPDRLAISGLYTYATYMENQGLNASDYWLALWKKTLQPLGTAAMVLLAISFVFGPLRSVTMGFRIFCGLLAGLGFKYTQDLLGPMSLVYGFSPALATIVPIAIAGSIGVVLLRRAG